MFVGLIRTLCNRDESVRVLRVFSSLLGQNGYEYWSEILANCANDLALQTSIRGVFTSWKNINRLIGGWGSLTDQLPLRDNRWHEGRRIPYSELTEIEKAYVGFLKFFSHG